VSVEDSGGNVVTTNTSAVTLAIASQPGSGAALTCNANPVTASAGVASFAGCKITGKAGSYTLKATDGSLSSATSSSFSLMNFAAKAAGLVGMSDAAPEVPSP
jgi:trimeric autotransporter adhesin